MNDARISGFRLRLLAAAGVALASVDWISTARATSSESTTSTGTGTSTGTTSSTSSETTEITTTDGEDDSGLDSLGDSSCAGGGTCGGGCGCYGRPYIAEDTMRRASIGANGGWSGPLAARDAEVLDEELRMALVASWTDAALAEHSSIAGFHRFALDLLAHGAPAELVRAAGRAALQELEHARACFALASRYAGREIGAGTMPLGASAKVATSLAELATWTIREGCIGETVAAWLATEVHHLAVDDEVRAVMAMIAREEGEHAELAWATIRWAIAAGGRSVADAVAVAFADAPSLTMPRSAIHCPAHGLLASTTITTIMRRGYAELVVPCAHALLAAITPPSRHGHEPISIRQT